MPDRFQLRVKFVHQRLSIGNIECGDIVSLMPSAIDSVRIARFSTDVYAGSNVKGRPAGAGPRPGLCPLPGQVKGETVSNRWALNF